MNQEPFDVKLLACEVSPSTHEKHILKLLVSRLATLIVRKDWQSGLVRMLEP